MKIVRAVLALGAVSLLQMLISLHLPAVARRCDLFTIFTVYVALTRAQRPALILGSCAGLAQDALADTILGLNGFKKTLLAYLVGTLGSLFMLNQTLPRFGILFAAAFFDPLTELGLSLAMGQHFVFPGPLDLLQRGLGNGLVGLFAFWVASRIPS
jgi:rod shape-determining protein MreD